LTKKTIAMGQALKVFLPLVIKVLKNSGVMVIDEVDAKLQPKLICYIIELFTNSKFNARQAQLIFTSHDLTTMQREVFRWDEYGNLKVAIRWAKQRMAECVAKTLLQLAPAT
jgi:AAA15 family ATPase/GTPase